MTQRNLSRLAGVLAEDYATPQNLAHGRVPRRRDHVRPGSCTLYGGRAGNLGLGTRRVRVLLCRSLQGQVCKWKERNLLEDHG